MDLPIILSVLTSIIFAIIAIIFSSKEENLKKKLKHKENNLKTLNFKSQVSEETINNINSINAERLMQIFTNYIDNLIPYTTVSSLTKSGNTLHFQAKIKEPVSELYITQIKNNMLRSLAEISTQDPLPSQTTEKISGSTTPDSNITSPTSFFNIPIEINNNILGIITISSHLKNPYLLEEMDALIDTTSLITKAITAKEQVIDQEKTNEKIFINSLEDGMFLIDKDSYVVMINSKAKSLLNVDTSSPTIIDILSSLPNTYNFSEKIKKSLTSLQKIEEKDILHNGKYLNITINPILGQSSSSQKAQGASFIIHDNTEQRSVNKMKEDFTNIFVHELRSPLTSIKASSEMLIKDQSSFTDEEKIKLLEIINTQTTKMLDQVSTILDAAKIESGLFTVQKNKADLKKIVEDNVKSIRQTAQEKTINLKTNIDQSLPELNFDTYNVGKAISSILSNSLKFTPSGGTIDIHAWFDPQKIYVNISDTGSGIPKDKQHLLFKKFTQIKSPNATVGTGLGLYVAKGIVEAHGGNITLISEPDKGTSVTFTLPLNTQFQPSTLQANLQKPTNHLPN